MTIKNFYEDEKQEFKTSLAQLDNGIDSLVAMLNKHCEGSVYFGVANSGEIVGVKGQLGEETIKKISSRVAEIVKPVISCEIAFQEYEGKTVIKLSAKGNNRPYSSNGNYIIRMGSENKKIDPSLLGELFFSSQSSSIEYVETYNQNLTFNSLKLMFVNKGLTINRDNFEDNMHFKINGKYNYLANLLADENDISIKVVRFEGKDKLKMVSRNEYGYKCLLNAMKQANDYVLSMNETRVDIDSSLERIETPLFDSHAFEEAWTNACLHNKWIKNVPPAIYIYSDRIEIVSTGGLAFDYSEENFYKGISYPVNPGLQRIMVQLGLVEQTGHGNLLIISKYGKEAFNIGDNFITVTIPFAFTPYNAIGDNTMLSPNETKVLTALKNYPTYSIKEIASLVGLGTTRTSEIIAELKKKNKIKRIGSKNGGYWSL